MDGGDRRVFYPDTAVQLRTPIPNGNTSFTVNRIPWALSMLSRIMTLEPGDIVATGVPAPTAPLTPGDTVEITIDRLGTLRNYVVAEEN